MGWDAYAVRPDIDPRISDENLLTPTLEEVFRRASQKLYGTNSNNTFNLASGTLGGLSVGILARATGIPDYDETSVDGSLLWSPDAVKRANDQARWDLQTGNDVDSILTTEAQLFLDVCAAHGLAILFDW